jgi:hypothetical protein
MSGRAGKAESKRDPRGRWLAVAAAGVALELLLSAPAAACSVCYGRADKGAALVSSARLGVFLLLGITVAMLAAFARFFFVLRNRALAAERDAIALEWSDLQRSSMP